MGTNTSARVSIDSSSVLLAVIQMLLIGGINEHDILPLCEAALKRAKKRARRLKNQERNSLSTAALVLDKWHRDRRYLTRAGKPRAIRLKGPTPSVTALIKAQGIKDRVPQIADRLVSVGLISHSGSGMFRPVSDSAVISSSDPLVIQHAARSLLTMLETVNKNVSGAEKLEPLIERFAEVPDLPSKYADAFRLFTQSQGEAFLKTVNDWLEARRARNSPKKGNVCVRAGIHTYAYVTQK